MSTLFSDTYRARFSGIARLYGEAGLLRFSQAHIAVIGIGGVGSWAAEALARSGIGKLTLIDMDDVCISNTNRQIHVLQHTIGKPKIEVMAERIRAINPECSVHECDDFVTLENIVELISPSYDYVIDAIDNVRVKAALLTYCRRQKIPIITIGGAGGQRDPTQIEVKDLAKTVHDPLASKVKERLKYRHRLSKNSKGKYGIDCVFSHEQPIYPQKDGSICATKQPTDGSSNCDSGFGTTTMVTASFGLAAAAHLLKKLLEKIPSCKTDKSPTMGD